MSLMSPHLCGQHHQQPKQQHLPSLLLCITPQLSSQKEMNIHCNQKLNPLPYHGMFLNHRKLVWGASHRKIHHIPRHL